MADFAVSQSELRTRRAFPAIARQLGLAFLLALLAFGPYLWAVIIQHGLPFGYGSGVGSGPDVISHDVEYYSAPWWTLLVGLLLSLVMVRNLLSERQRAEQRAGAWRAGMLLGLVALFSSVFVLWQAPIAPLILFKGNIQLLDFFALVLGIYPCFIVALVSVFLWREAQDQPGERKIRWRGGLLCLPTVLVSVGFCLLLRAKFPGFIETPQQGYYQPPSLRLDLAQIIPTWLGVSLLGGVIGASLRSWLLPAQNSRAETPEAPRIALWVVLPQVGWGFLWRLALAGLAGILCTGVLFGMTITVYPIIGSFGYRFPPQLILGLHTSTRDWLLPPYILPLLNRLPTSLLDFRTIWYLAFLPFLFALVSVLVDRSAWKSRAVLARIGSVFALLFLALGVKDLLLVVLANLAGIWPAGPGSAVLGCAELLCETTALALALALALGRISRLTNRWGNYLLWLLIGAASFAGGFLTLQFELRNILFYVALRSPQLASLTASEQNFTLALGAVLALGAAWLGGWLRDRVTPNP